MVNRFNISVYAGCLALLRTTKHPLFQLNLRTSKCAADFPVRAHDNLGFTRCRVLAFRSYTNRHVSALLGLRKGLSLCHDIRRQLTEEQQHRVATAS